MHFSGKNKAFLSTKEKYFCFLSKKNLFFLSYSVDSLLIGNFNDFAPSKKMSVD
jgi:hypothetical protein